MRGASAHFPRLSTDRLILRQATRQDALAVFAIFQDPDVLRYYNVDQMVHRDEAVAMIESRARRFEIGAGIRWAICLKETDEYIGSCGFEVWHRAWHFAEIGYELGRPNWGKGYMSEALRCIIRYGFDEMHLHRVEAQVEPPNEHSKNVLLRLGFKEEGVARERGYWGRAYHDLVQFGLLPQDFKL